ncbi:MAG TPA: HD domain-containing phosphohydrolase [Jatrophihabitans sp.]|jgi:HD-GYP domain-containing protein (c-di-GMP phosphodiesterase class II)
MGDGVRLAELVAALSLATDLGLGQPQEHGLRQTVIAGRLASAAGMSEDERTAAYFVSLLSWVGCVADSHELARWFGDDVRVRAASFAVDRAGLPMLRFMLGQLDTSGTGRGRIAETGLFMSRGVRQVMNGMAAHCQTTGAVAARLGVPAHVQRALPQALERWDGKGGPAGLKGTAIEPVMRVAHIANDAEVVVRTAGIDATLTMLTARSGRQFDPDLVALCVDRPTEIFGGLDGVDNWRDAMEGCALLDRPMTAEEESEALKTLADLADLKSPWFTGHSRALADLAEKAALNAQCSAADVGLVRDAGCVARLGAIGISAAIWSKAGPLTSVERERVRTVPYLTERILGRCGRLATIGSLAAMAHERMDGSGYPRGSAGPAIPGPARLLAASLVYRALREDRPYRPALSSDAAAAALKAEADEGRLDAGAVAAVLAAAQGRSPRRPASSSGLTPREIEVLQLLVRGLTNKQIATRLTLSGRTVGTHIEHIYAKAGVNTRGAAAMYAMRSGLVDASTPFGQPGEAKIG